MGSPRLGAVRCVGSYHGRSTGPAHMSQDRFSNNRSGLHTALSNSLEGSSRQTRSSTTRITSYISTALPMLLAVLVLTLIHPGAVLQGPGSSYPKKLHWWNRGAKREFKRATKEREDWERAAELRSRELLSSLRPVSALATKAKSRATSHFVRCARSELTARSGYIISIWLPRQTGGKHLLKSNYI